MFHAVLWSLPDACQDLIRHQNTFQSLHVITETLSRLSSIKSIKSITKGHIHRTILPCFTFTMPCLFCHFPFMEPVGQ